MKQEVSLCDSLTGFVIPINMPDGRKLNVSVEEVIDPSYSKIIKGEGLLDKERNTRGDLIITFHINFPKKLLPIQRNLLHLALRLPQDLTNANNIQTRLLETAMRLPPNLAETERQKVRYDCECLRARCCHSWRKVVREG
mmetsp:Transcript_24580/g.80572  ORF Transcript_24580/g.80572 Transcript_24580/m.80572 type:complete len:140 (+) Transcript_24580:711-1130(+)